MLFLLKPFMENYLHGCRKAGAEADTAVDDDDFLNDIGDGKDDADDAFIES